MIRSIKNNSIFVKSLTKQMTPRAIQNAQKHSPLLQFSDNRPNTLSSLKTLAIIQRVPELDEQLANGCKEIKDQIEQYLNDPQIATLENISAIIKRQENQQQYTELKNQITLLLNTYNKKLALNINEVRKYIAEQVLSDNEKQFMCKKMSHFITDYINRTSLSGEDLQSMNNIKTYLKDSELPGSHLDTDIPKCNFRASDQDLSIDIDSVDIPIDSDLAVRSKINYSLKDDLKKSLYQAAFESIQIAKALHRDTSDFDNIERNKHKRPRRLFN